MELLAIVILLPFILWVISMTGLKYSGTKIHKIWKKYIRFIIKFFIFFIPLSIANGLLVPFIGVGVFNLILSVTIALIIYHMLSKRYAKKLIENLFYD